MRDGKHGDVPFEPNEDDVIGEIVNRQPSHIAIANPRDESPGLGKPLEMIKRLPDFGSETVSDLSTSFAIPLDRFAELASRARAKPNGSQRDNTSR